MLLALPLLAIILSFGVPYFGKKRRRKLSFPIPPDPPGRPDGPIPEDVTPMLDASADEISPLVEPGDDVEPEDDGPVLVDWGGPAGSEFDATDLAEQTEGFNWEAHRAEQARARRAATEEIIDKHRRSGGEVLDGEWIAPTVDTVTPPPKTGRYFEPSHEWSNAFINVRTFEWVTDPDPLFYELSDRYMRPGATDFDDGVPLT